MVGGGLDPLHDDGDGGRLRGRVVRRVLTGGLEALLRQADPTPPPRRSPPRCLPLGCPCAGGGPCASERPVAPMPSISAPPATRCASLRQTLRSVFNICVSPRRRGADADNAHDVYSIPGA